MAIRASRAGFVLADRIVHADIENLIHSRQSSGGLDLKLSGALFCRVASRAGLQINEALCVCLKDVERYDGSVRVLHGRGGRSTTVGPDPGVTTVIERWLDARSRLNLDPTGRSHVSPGGRHPVFCTLNGHSMAAAYVRVMLKRLAARAGIDKRVHAHGLRHTHAAQLRAEGVDIAIISRQLGHTSIATTARYLDHIASRAVIEAEAGRERKLTLLTCCFVHWSMSMDVNQIRKVGREKTTCEAFGTYGPDSAMT